MLYYIFPFFRIENPRVTGSIPVRATKSYNLNQRLMLILSRFFTSKIRYTVIAHFLI
jgi:hypothetical protein